MTTTPRTWVVGEVVTAAMLNQEIRDQFASFFGTWTPWTPTWLAEGGAEPTLGNGQLSGRYLKIGRSVDWTMRLDWGSTTAAGGGGANENWAFVLPFPPASTSTTRTALADARDASTDLHYGATGLYATSDGGVVRSFINFDASSNGLWDSGQPMSWAAGDVLSAWGTYEAAS